MSHRGRERALPLAASRLRSIAKPVAAYVILCVLVGFSVAAPPPDLLSVAREGEKLSDEQAARLETTADRDPADGNSRAALLGYYLPRKAAKRDRRDKVILWVIDRKPDDPVAGSAYCLIDAADDPDGYAAVDKAWDKKLADKPTTAIKSSAAVFKAASDFDGAERLLQQLRDAEPKSSKWPVRLADLYDQHAATHPDDDARLAAGAVQLRQSAYDLTADPTERFRILSRMPTAAMRSHDVTAARKLGNQLTATAKSFKSDPYYGYAVHAADVTLGRIAAAEGNFDKAAEYLTAAGRVPASAPLAAEGVDTSLAADLLKHGDRATVKDYLDTAQRLWPAGGQRMRAWSTAVDNGDMPDFKR